MNPGIRHSSIPNLGIEKLARDCNPIPTMKGLHRGPPIAAPRSEFAVHFPSCILCKTEALQVATVATDFPAAMQLTTHSWWRDWCSSDDACHVMSRKHLKTVTLVMHAVCTSCDMINPAVWNVEAKSVRNRTWGGRQTPSLHPLSLYPRFFFLSFLPFSRHSSFSFSHYSFHSFVTRSINVTW